MKTISIKAILFGCVFSASSLFAQTEKKEQTVRDLPELNMTEGVNIHFISPEPIQFVDLSTDELIGDLPSENIARIKITNKQEQDSVKVIKQKRNSLSWLSIKPFLETLWYLILKPISKSSQKICNLWSFLK